MKKRIVIPFVFAMSLGLSTVHAAENSTTPTKQPTQTQVKVQKPQQLKDLQVQIKALRVQKEQLNCQIKSAFKAKMDSFKQQEQQIKGATGKTKQEKKAALTELKGKVTSLRNDYKAYSGAVKKLWEDRKSKWESFRGHMKDRQYDVAITELQTIQSNLTEAISLKQQFLAKLSN
ncbi:hypothetical protein J5Y03_16890 [Bacillus sp. RG28]|uniref:Uncharacterized protein n=1 Tax=Gottfriedia endophytica TaxID=2820819 RepID=A0A940NLU1_9BACI|nr:hypothetical protein [Gottfriedia endophytica]MBP0726835.1 hypothetical protein [Gottfriedia endophytica]